LADLDETYTDIGASLELHDNVIELPSIRGKSRGEQAFTGAGSVEFDGFRPSDYRLDISFSDFWVTRQPDFEAQFSGALAVTTYQEDDRRIPNITGRLSVKQADIVYTFESGGRRPTVTMPTASPGWLCSIDVDAHKNLWVRNPDMYVELGGQLIVKRDNDGLYLRGDLSALRGSYNVYNNKFQVVEGTIDFSAAEGIRPEVYINAYTPHRVADGQESRIYLTLRWPRDKIEPEIELSSDEPGYYQSDLWRMLGGTDIAGGLAANTLEKLLNQQMSGMTVYVDRQATGRLRGGSPEQQMMIGVGKYLFEDLYLTYRQGITYTADQVVEAEYRLRNMIYIRSGIIRHSNPRYAGSILRNTDEYNLDVKFRWEY
jgi:autotransporter translocation and assembly factor TamB